MKLTPGGISLNGNAGATHEQNVKAAKALEEQFASMLLKSMRSASPDDPSGGDNTYREMSDRQLAKSLTEGRGLGLARAIVRQLDRQAGLIPATRPTQGPMQLNPPATPMRLDGPTTPAAPTVPQVNLQLAPSSSGVSITAMPMAMPAPAIPTPFSPSSAAAAYAANSLQCDPNAQVECESPEAFVKSIWPHAQQTAKELGVSPRALVAQAALETNWGKSMIGDGANPTSNNLFGIKAGRSWSGEVVTTGTHEYVAGERRDERATFRAYRSVSESFRDYARLLRGDRYDAARASGQDVEQFANALQRAGYATDPAYAKKIHAIANGETMQRAIASLPFSVRG